MWFRPESILTNGLQNFGRKEVHKLVMIKGSDTDIMNALTELYAIFHEIVGQSADKKNNDHSSYGFLKNESYRQNREKSIIQNSF